MKHSLPLSYPEMFKRFIEQGESRYRDTFIFNSHDYLIEPLGDDFDIMRVTNQTTGDVYNFTEHDYSITYVKMPHVNEMLNYIESQVIFTAWDWIEHFTKLFPTYEGQLVTIYNDRDKNQAFVYVHTDKDNSFYLSKTHPPRVTGQLIYDYSENNSVRYVEVSVSDCGETADYINKVPGECEEILQSLFNTESALNFINTNRVRDDDAAKPDMSIWSLPPVIEFCGQSININAVHKQIEWTSDDYDYFINENGQWTKTRIDKEVRAGNSIRKQDTSVTAMFSIKFAYITIKENREHANALGIVTMLNILADESSASESV